MDLCRNHDVKIVNGRSGLDSDIGKYTCIKLKGNSIINYGITSTSLLKMISILKVHSLVKCLSDTHCPINLYVSLKCTKFTYDNQDLNIHDENPYGESNFNSALSLKHCKLYPNTINESILCSLEET